MVWAQPYNVELGKMDSYVVVISRFQPPCMVECQVTFVQLATAYNVCHFLSLNIFSFFDDFYYG